MTKSDYVMNVIVCFQISGVITKVTELKNSNLHLGRELEQAVEQYDCVTTEKNETENQLEIYQVFS